MNREDIEKLEDFELRKAVALHNGYRWGIVGTSSSPKEDTPIYGFIAVINGREYMGIGVPDWEKNYSDAFSLVEEWRLAPTPPSSVGIHEISITYEDYDGTMKPLWYCYFAQYTDKTEDYQWFYSSGETPQVAICRAYVLWKEGLNDNHSID